MGEEVTYADVEAIGKRVAEFLHRTSTSADDSVASKQRLAVWFRGNDGIEQWDPARYTRIDRTGTVSEFDIGRES
jgi:hypothetical protein